MSTPLAIKITITDTGYTIGSDVYNAVYDFIKNNQDVDLYKLEPKLSENVSGVPRVIGAGYDAIIILSITANIATIASLLWMAYDKYIAQKSKHCGLYLSMGKGNNKIDLYIGKEYKEKDIFIKAFIKSVSQTKDSKDGKEDFDETILMLKSSDDWVKR